MPNALSRLGGAAYSYDWIHQPTSSDKSLAEHLDEIPYTLGLNLNQEYLSDKEMSSNEMNFTKKVLTYWTNFAHSG